MEFPVGPEDVKIVPGASGKGLQVTCSCGCVNWNHLEVLTSQWSCRNCGQVLSHYFPGLVVKVLEMQKPEIGVPAPASGRPAEPEASPAKA